MPAGTHHAVIQENGVNKNYIFTFDKDVTYGGVLDLTSLETIPPEKLAQLLALADKTGGIEAGYVSLETPAGLELYQLVYGVHPRVKYQSIKYYDVVDHCRNHAIGLGKFGAALSIIGSIKPRFFNASDLFFSDGERERLTKKLTNNLIKTRHEADLMKRLDYLKVREMNVHNNGHLNISMIPMRRFHGPDLMQLLAMDENVRRIAEISDQVLQSMNDFDHVEQSEREMNAEATLYLLDELQGAVDDWLKVRRIIPESMRSSLDIKGRIDLSIALLRNVKLIHAHQILHRDLKPANVMLEVSRWGFWKPAIIDLGLSVDAGETKMKRVGAPYYIAPECINKIEYSFKSDAYAVARIIGLIWRDQNLAQYDKNDIRKFLLARMTEELPDFDLFFGLNLSKLLKEKILNVLQCMTISNLNERLNIEAALEKFEEIRLEYYYSQSSPDHHASIQFAHEAALRLLGMENSILSGSGILNAPAYISQVKQTIEGIEDHDAAVRIFIDTLGVSALTYCENKQSLLDHVTDIAGSFMGSYQAYCRQLSKLEKFSEKIDSELWQSRAGCFRLIKRGHRYSSEEMQQIKNAQLYVDYCNDLLVKLGKSDLGLNAMVELTEHMNEKTEKMKDALNYYKSRLCPEMQTTADKPAHKAGI